MIIKDFRVKLEGRRKHKWKIEKDYQTRKVNMKGKDKKDGQLANENENGRGESESRKENKAYEKSQ